MLKRILNDFARVKGIVALAVIGRDGFVIESVTAAENADLDVLAAMASTEVGTAEALGSAMSLGGLTQVMIESDQGPILLTTLTEHELLAVIAEPDVNLGRIRHEIRKNKKKLADVLT